MTEYQVWLSKSSTTGFTKVATTTSTSWTDTSLARRTTYYYRVRAGDAAGNLGAFSATKSARTT